MILKKKAGLRWPPSLSRRRGATGIETDTRRAAGRAREHPPAARADSRESGGAYGSGPVNAFSKAL